ncbi:MAG: TIGR02584 family CRISPR-associated protein [Verrucomicrobia bacterium]|nr:TIGR02584 family CRISPR-associated protein [Verrucomicrobiota bacterium]
MTGMSPAVLTETVWALANPQDASSPILPDDVVAITTAKGQQTITEQLLTPAPDFGGQTIWQALRHDLLGANVAGDGRLTLRITLIEQRDPASGATRPLEDIRHPEENLAAAEFILGQVRQHTTAKDRRLIASLAGGRKTMSALLHAAFSHLARPQDRLTHILVNEPFESPALKPRFFYPGQPSQTLTAPDGKTYQARDARLDLADVPFAPLRLRFPDIAEIPSRFADLVRTYSETFRRDATQLAVIELLNDPPRVVVNGLPVEMEGERQLTVIRFLLAANQKQWLQKDQGEALEIFKAWHGYAPQLELVRPALRETVRRLHDKRKAKPGDAWIAKAVKEDIKRPLSFLRTALDQAEASWKPPPRDLRLPAFTLAGDS